MSWSSPSRGNGRGQAASSSSSRAAGAPVGRISSPKKASSSLLSSPVLNADLLESQARLDGDESGLLSSAGEIGRGLDDLTLDDPTVSAPKLHSRRSTQARNSTSPSKQRGGRPSWGPKSSPVKGNIRLLDGLTDSRSPQHATSTKKERTLGALSYGGVKGAQKARQSIFARPQQQVTTKSSSMRKSRSSVAADEEGEDSFYNDRGLSTSSTSIRGQTSDRKLTTRVTAGKSQSSGRASMKELPAANEHYDHQLSELKRLNTVFEAYEQMLVDSSGQLDDFSTRISETNALLDSYIDLMRQTERTQQLLLDGDWHGVTEDETAHALAMELAEREQRQRQEQAEEEARKVARRAQEADAARIAAEVAQEQQQRRGVPGRTGTRPSAVPSSMRGARGGASRGSGIPTRGRGGVAQGSVRGRVISTASSTGRTVSGGSATARSVSSSSGLSKRYEGVRSSGYGPQ